MEEDRGKVNGSMADKGKRDRGSIWRHSCSRVLLLCMALMAAGGICAGCSSFYTAERIQLMKTEGTVDISNSRGKELEPVPEMKLYSGYQVATEKASYAWLNLDSVKLAKMDVDSQISVAKKRNGLEVLVDSGNLYFHIKEPLKEDETLDIRTSNLSVGIRGTCGWVEVADPEHMKVYILEGTVTCTVDAPRSRESKEASVSGGQMAELTIDPEAEKGQVCEIVPHDFAVEDIAGFVLEELTKDEDLCGKIYEESGLKIDGNGGDGRDAAGSGSGDGTADGNGDGSAEGGDTVESTPLDPEAEAAWQQAYRTVLDQERAKAAASTDPYGDEAAQAYQLYDIDKDGVPELFVHFGVSEVAARADVYTCKDSEAVLMEKEMSTGHSTFYTYPGENAILAVWGHMGYLTYSKISLADGALTSEVIYETEISSYADADYLEPEEVVPGAVIIEVCRLEQDIFLYRYREIMRNMGKERSYAQDGPKDEALRQRFLQVIREGGTVYGASVDGYGNVPGYRTFAEYCGPGVVYGSIRSALAVRQYAFADVDLDGQEECILRMEETAEDPGILDDIYVVLHLEADQVYAYSLLFFSGEVLENGVFVHGYPNGSAGGERMIFDREACFFYYVRHDKGAAPVQWMSLDGQSADRQGGEDVAGEALPLIDPTELAGYYSGRGQGAKANVNVEARFFFENDRGQGAKANVNADIFREDGEERIGNILIKSGPDAYIGELVWSAADTYKLYSIGRSAKWEGVTYRDVTAADGDLSVEADRQDGAVTLWFYRDGELIDIYTMNEPYES